MTSGDTLPLRFETAFLVPLVGYISIGSAAGPLRGANAQNLPSQDVVLTIDVQDMVQGTVTVYVSPDSANKCYALFDLKTFDQIPDGSSTTPGDVYNDAFFLFDMPVQ